MNERRMYVVACRQTPGRILFYSGGRDNRVENFVHAKIFASPEDAKATLKRLPGYKLYPVTLRFVEEELEIV